MNRKLNLLIWSLPLLGFALGYAIAYLFFHGLLETWHLVGKPGENIVQILGVREARDLLVAAETGRIFSLGFADGDDVSLSLPPRWGKEAQDSSDPVQRLEYYGADFYTVPLLFRVVQLYDMEYIYRGEGKGAVKFALASNGNLWMWSHEIAGLTGLVLYFYPATGFLVGLVVTLSIKGVQWLKAAERTRHPPRAAG